MYSEIARYLCNSPFDTLCKDAADIVKLQIIHTHGIVKFKIIYILFNQKCTTENEVDFSRIINSIKILIGKKAYCLYQNFILFFLLCLHRLLIIVNILFEKFMLKIIQAFFSMEKPFFALQQSNPFYC